MTTRTKRSAKSSRIEALIGSDRGLLKDLVKEALHAVLEAEMTETVGAGPGERIGWSNAAFWVRRQALYVLARERIRRKKAAA